MKEIFVIKENGTRYFLHQEKEGYFTTTDMVAIAHKFQSYSDAQKFCEFIFKTMKSNRIPGMTFLQIEKYFTNG